MEVRVMAFYVRRELAVGWIETDKAVVSVLPWPIGNYSHRRYVDVIVVEIEEPEPPRVITAPEFTEHGVA